ncbi:IS3 family transposase [Chitinophaga silvatica]|uniref:IS3 family transposase n=1 Tax=Chitinophaga silvatica TaxID=2282649 RepID=A0A3E1Y5Q5_9BACT|nr:IS3 family transposase [Chitinophaga silvatica]RFS20080.1 IS3 family transposase [Chitinophaga silvatica]
MALIKEQYSRISLARLCGWFGITRQAYYQDSYRQIEVGIEESLVLKEINAIRTLHPKLGVRKIYGKIDPFLKSHQIKMGRDALFDLLARNNLLIRRRKRKAMTTMSKHWFRKYPNLITGIVPSRPNQIWVSDITYWKINDDRHLYISLVTDAYSKKIVGYHVADNLEAVGCLQALQMAVRTLKLILGSRLPLCHHSDRGIQYCSNQYVKLLQDNEIDISMTESGDPRDNAIAERINGILKNEYLSAYQVESIKEACNLLHDVVGLYNNDRPHMSISNLYPNFVHHNQVETTRLWKNYYHRKTVVKEESD